MSTATVRIGIGHDSHRLEPGGPLRVGGIDVPADHRAVGHSDADVLLHAIIDAMLGVAGLGDIGELFPDTSPDNRGRDSAEMLEVAYAHVRERGFSIINIDCILFLESPKLGEFKSRIAQRICQLLSLDADRVSIKAKTGEQMDAVGQRRAVAATSVVLLTTNA